MSNILVKGIMPAMITPLDAGGNIIRESIFKNMDRNYSQGAAGFYICGSTGEGPVLTAEKRKEVAETVMEANNGRGIVVNHVGAASPDEAFDLARHAKKIGCSGVSSVVPNFYFKYTEDEVVDYYKRLADAAEIPVIAYAQGLLTGDVVSLMKRLIEIDGVINTMLCSNYQGTFSGCANLETIRFAENCIRSNIDFSACVSLTKESLISIANGLNDEDTAAVTLPRAPFVSILSAEDQTEITDIITGKGWNCTLV